MTDSDGRWQTTTRRSALGLMSVGAAFVATETLGFTQLSADRGVNVGIADDLDAVLGLEGDSSDETVEGDPLSNLEEQEIEDDLTITFTNQSDVTLEDASNDLIVTIDETGGESGLTVTTNDDFDSDDDITAGDEVTYNINADLSPTEHASIELQNDEGDDATIDVTVDAEFNGTALNLTREDITITGTSS